jgi:hypothetical protein
LVRHSETQQSIPQTRLPRLPAARASRPRRFPRQNELAIIFFDPAQH